MASGNFRRILKSGGFQAFIWTQFLGAFNDNVYKIALSMVAVNVAGQGLSAGGYVSLAGAVFIAPFLLFSGYGGHLADAYNKRIILIITKSFEIVAVAVGLVAFYFGRMDIMFIGLFFMATHSAFFSPSKYGIVPEIVEYRDLSAANGILEMSTFIAIIIGTAGGTLLYSVWKEQLHYIGLFLLVVAFIGTGCSFGIPRATEPVAGKKINVNPFSEIIGGTVRLWRHQRFLFMTVMAITFFFYFGALLQMDLLLLGKEVMKLPDLWIGLMITFLALGIGFGAIVAGRLSGEKVEPGLIPIGSVIMGAFTVLLGYVGDSYAMTVIVLALMGFSGGIFIVPLNALLQRKSAQEERGRIIATNNFLNTFGVLAASATLWLMHDVAGIGADRIIVIFGTLAIAFTGLIVVVLHRFMVRFSLWFLTHTFYDIKILGKENVPERGPALIVANHVSFIDGFLVGACAQRFIRYVVYDKYTDHWFLKPLLRFMRVIPIGEGGKRGVVEAIKAAREELKAGHVVCVFAEGEISRTGNLLPFKKGFERIAEGLDVPIVPVHLDRVWGSLFSFKSGRFFWKRPELQARRPVTVSFGGHMRSPVTSEAVRHRMLELSADAFDYRVAPKETLLTRFVVQAKRSPLKPCAADSTGRSLTFVKALAGSLALSSVLRKRLAGEEKVGVMLPASVASALANAAIGFAGKTPVNLNFTAPRSSIESMLGQCGIKTVISSSAFLSKAGLKEPPGFMPIEELAAGITGLQRFGAVLAALFVPAGLVGRIYGFGKDDSWALATVIFTSGSSGEPKGVMLTHRNIISNIEGFHQIIPSSSRETVMGVLPFFHSFGFTATLWYPLITGNTAVYHLNPLDAKTVGEMVDKHGATMIMGTPTFFSAYARTCPREQFRSIRLAVAGAERLRDGVAREFKEKFGIDILEGYGCTEMSPVVSVNVPNVAHGDVSQKGRSGGTVGHPIPGVAVKVVDPDTLVELAPGNEGLLLIKGGGAMTGYLAAPEKTAEVFMDGWYVTGDIASIGPDGFITITDRVSRFSKIGGEMVPHVKVEDAMARILGSHDCAVTAVPDEQKGERLVAFYSSANVAAADLWEKLLKSGLPNLWIPKKDSIFKIAAIPVTAAGKLESRKLKAMAMELCGIGGAEG